MSDAAGFRCRKDAIEYVVLSGDLGNPGLDAHDQVSMPSGSRPEQLVWVRKEIREILERERPSAVAFKGIEGQAQKKDPGRAEVEGVLQEACQSAGVPPVKRLKKQIKKDIGHEGSAKYVSTSIPEKLRGAIPRSRDDAMLAALAALASLQHG